MIKTIPWDKVDIEVILLDNIDAEKVNRNRKYSQINHPGIRSENPIPEIEHKLCSLLFNYMLRKPILWPKNLSYGLSKHYLLACSGMIGLCMYNVHLLIQVSPGSRLETIQFLDTRNFQYIGNLYDDIFVRRDLLNSKYKINIEEADEHFKRFSSDLMFQSEKLENKGFSYISKYLLNLNKYDPNLTTRNCLTWMAQTTPSHKYVLPR